MRKSNRFDPDQDRYSVGPDLGPNCLQRLSAETKVAASKEKVTVTYSYAFGNVLPRLLFCAGCIKFPNVQLSLGSVGQCPKKLYLFHIVFIICPLFI